MGNRKNNGFKYIIILGTSLIIAGLFLIIQSALGKFLPHDVKSIGMTAEKLLSFREGKVVYFMFHDRVSFGGSLISTGILYNWLSLVPLRQKKSWAWWVILIASIYGFGSFFSYIGFGYFDYLHAIATLILFIIFVLGMYLSYPGKKDNSLKKLFNVPLKTNLKSKEGIGKLFLFITSICLTLGGIVILIVGMSIIFVPQDLEYMKIGICGLENINKNLISVIAHDRASFGGGLGVIGIMLFFILIHAEYTKKLWLTLFIAISIGFWSAIIIHFIIGYTDFWHLSPAYLGLFNFYLGSFLSYKLFK